MPKVISGPVHEADAAVSMPAVRAADGGFGPRLHGGGHARRADVYAQLHVPPHLLLVLEPVPSRAPRLRDPGIVPEIDQAVVVLRALVGGERQWGLEVAAVKSDDWAVVPGWCGET